METSDNENMNEFENRTDLSGLEKMVRDLRDEISKVIVGQEQMIDLLLVAILADGHVLIEGNPGVAKTLTTRLLAECISTTFSRIQFTPDLMPADVVGTSVYNPKITDFEFKQGPAFTNILLIDEINRSPAKTQSALFEVMEERQITVDGNTYPLTEPFMVVATQNPIDHEGTYRLPEAQLDRFLFKIEVPYPSLDEEISILEGSLDRSNRFDLSMIEKVISSDEIIIQRKAVQEIHVSAELMKYIAEITHNTRNSGSLSVGASPRASVYLMRAAQAWAATRGRDFVTPEDVKSVVTPALRHRIMLTPEKEMEGVDPDQVIKQILEKTEVPR